MRLGPRLAAAALAALAFAAPALAQSGTTKLLSTPAEKFAVAPGGVDMRSGRYAYSETDLSIGGEGGALALTRILSADVPGHGEPFGNFSHNWDVMISEVRRYDEPTAEQIWRMYVHFGGRSQTYQAELTGFSQLSDGPLTPLTHSGDRLSASVVYTYQAADGTLAVFRPLGYSDCSTARRCAFVSEITEPDGTRYSFDYVASGGAGGTVRLARVTSSRGYALLLEGSGNRVTKACVFNLALAPAPAPGAVCPAGAAATSSYAYAAGSPARLASVTQPGGGMASFTYAQAGSGATDMGFVKPGQSAPWLTNRLHSQLDEEWVAHEIVDRQLFADGQSYDYGYGGGPAVNGNPGPLAGGFYTDALGHTTEVLYDWPAGPNGNHPGSLCRQLPCPPPMPGDPSIVYQQTPGPVAITDPLGRTTSFDYCDPVVMAGLPAQEDNRCVVLPAQSFTDPEGARTNLEYDERRNISRMIRHPKPGALNPDGTTPSPIVTSAVYDLQNPKASSKPLSMTDGRGNTTHWTYSTDHGGVLTETGPAVDGATPQKRYAYAWRTARLANGDPAGPPVAVPARMAFCRIRAPAAGGAGCAVDPADEVVTTYDYGPETGPLNLLLRGEAVSADGVTLRTCYAYDGRGRRISETGANANLAACPASPPTAALPYTSSTRYDAMDRVTGTIAPADSSGAFAAVRNSYDSAGRLTRVEQGSLAAWQGETVAPSAWPGFTILKTLDTQYDALDRKIRESAGGPGLTASVTEYGYDLAGRLLCTAVRMNPAAWATPLPDTCVPGPPHAVFGPDRISRSAYDSAGQPTESWDGVGTPLMRREAAWTYDGNGRKTSLTDARGFRAEMRYDAFGRQSRWIFPSKSAAGAADPADYEEYRYDPGGNRTWLRKRDGSILTFDHDALNRMTRKIVPERAGLAAAQTRDVHYAYDLRGLQLRARFDGVNGEGITNAYDGFGRLLWTNTNQSGPSRTLHYQYDPAGNRLRITHPGGAVLFGYAYDALGRVTAVHEKASPAGVDDYLVRYWYKPTGERQTAVRGGGAGGFTSSHYYDLAMRPSVLAGNLPATANDVSFTFGYNPASQIVSLSRNNDAYVWTGTFPASTAYAVNGQNQYTSVAGMAHGYDANGNLTSDGSTTYTYDVENRLVGASGAKTASLVYDPLGRLFQTSGGAAGATQFLYDGEALVAEYNSAGTLLKRYVHGPGADEPVAAYDGPALGLANRRYTLPDHQGSVVALINADGTPSSINTYNEYGVPGAGNAGRFQYTGQAWIPELGLYHYKARLYSPTLGRFLQVDPIGYEDQINLYTYVRNDPVTRADPSGKGDIYPRMREGANPFEEMADFFFGDLLEVARKPTVTNVTLAMIGMTPVGKAFKLLSAARRLERGAARKIKNAIEHETRATQFEHNPSVRPGMEGQPREIIARQQAQRTADLRTEAAEYRKQAAQDLERAKRLREEAERIE